MDLADLKCATQLPCKVPEWKKPISDCHEAVFTLQFVGAAAYRSHKTERRHNRAARLTLPNLSGLPYFIYIFINCLSVPALQPFKRGPGGLSNVDSKIAGQGEHRKLGLIALIVAESQLITGRVLPRGTAAQAEAERRMGSASRGF